ncbi:MAG: hypothetical protein AAGD32_10035 [Planctomycetota bacterium]
MSTPLELVTFATAAVDPTVMERFLGFVADNGWLFWVIVGVIAAVGIFLGYKLGHWAGARGQKAYVQSREKELFDAQRGFKLVFDEELKDLRTENDDLKSKIDTMTDRIEEYRKKAAGYGGLFSNSKNADAMYALLLENEALEEALYGQNEKLRQERTDSVKEQLRAAGYRRVLMSQLMEDERFKKHVEEVYGEDGETPGNLRSDRALPNKRQAVEGEHA